MSSKNCLLAALLMGATMVSCDATNWKTLRQKHQGIWGDYAYLDTLKKYNSVTKTQHIFEHSVIEIRISKSEIMTDTPFDMEPNPIDKDKYAISIVDKNTLILADKETGKQRQFGKFHYDEILDSDANFYSLFKYPMNKMHYKWFCGTYEMFDKAGDFVRLLEFDPYGHVKHYEDFTVYVLNSHYTSASNTDYILFTDSDFRQREYLLIEYTDGDYSFFTIKETEDWSEPFEKADLRFKLRKQNETKYNHLNSCSPNRLRE